MERADLGGIDIGRALVSKPGTIDAGSHKVIFHRPCAVCSRAFVVGDVACLVIDQDDINVEDLGVCAAGHRHIAVTGKLPAAIHLGCRWVFEPTTGRPS